MGSRRCPLVSAGAMVLVAAMALTAWRIALEVASASPVRQFPINSVTIISDPPPPDEPGQFSEATLLREQP